MNIAIVDDCPIERSQLSECITKTFFDSGLVLNNIIEFEDGKGLIKDFHLSNFDIIFLDIYMKDMSGIKTAEYIRLHDENVKIVFVTSSNDFASESFSVNAFHYLLKPITEAKIADVLHRININELNHNKTIQLPDGQKLLLRSIRYTEYHNHIITIYLNDNTTLTTRLQQKKIEDILTAFPPFFPCSKGIIVNFNYVKNIDDTMLTLDNGLTLPISRRRKKETVTAYHRHLLNKLKEHT